MIYYLRPHLGALLGPIFPLAAAGRPLWGFSKVHLERRTVSQRTCFDAFENMFVLRRYSKKRVSEVESVKQKKCRKSRDTVPLTGLWLAIV